MVIKMFKKHRKSSLQPTTTERTPHPPVKTYSLNNLYYCDFTTFSLVNVRAKPFLKTMVGDQIRVYEKKGSMLLAENLNTKEKGMIPDTSVELNFHCWNLYLPHVSSISNNIEILKEKISTYPLEMCELLCTAR